MIKTTLQELLSKFENERTWVDICTPLFRITGTIQSIINDHDAILDHAIDDWKVTLISILQINM